MLDLCCIPEVLKQPDTTSDKFTDSMPGTASASTAVAVDETMEDADAATDESLAYAYDGKRKFEIAFPPRPQPPCNCKLKICHACRPVYKDRAWQSLNKIVNTPQVPPSQFELDNRRVSNAAVILSIKPPVDTPFSKIRTSIIESWEERPAPKAVPRANKDRLSDLYSWTSTSQPMQHPKITRLQKHDTHNSDASDADDEKDFAQDDESEDSSTDFGGYSETYSEAEDAIGSFDSKRHSVQLLADGRASTVLRTRYRDDSGAGGGGKNAGHVDDKRVTPGRFVID